MTLQLDLQQFAYRLRVEKGTISVKPYSLSAVSRRRIVRAALTGIVLFVQTSIYGPYCQSPASLQSKSVGQSAPGPIPKFDVVTIKPSGKDSGYSYSPALDGFDATGQSLAGLILLAYIPGPLRSQAQIQNAPAWADQEDYDVVAKIAPEDMPAWRGRDGGKLRMEMLQSMLADRFKLIIHTVPAEASGFALVVAKRGSGLRPAAPDEALPSGIRLAFGGVFVRRNTPGGFVLSFHAAPMASLADFLSHGSHTFIEDKTGHTGPYDFDLRPRDDADQADRGFMKDPGSDYEFGLLGLKTVPAKVPSLTVVIDHAERPSPN